MKKKGKDLIFLNCIKGDGKSVCMVKKRLIELMKEDVFNVNCLSITNKTFIASGFNSFVVKLKQNENTLSNKN
tara:strand:- start:1113 stop:1331 length:219 start_codon:yes stop_codon:yes gene_type:complete